MEFGGINGAAVDLQYDKRINDLRFQQQQAQRAQALAEAKTNLFANDIEFQNAANNYDSPRLKELNKQQVQALGRYANENPDYTTNVDKLMQIKMMKRAIKDNPIAVRAVASDTAYKNYLNDLKEVAKNPNQHNVRAYDEIQKQWDNYNNHGNQYGEQAAGTHGEQAFQYTKPQDFIDLGKKGQTIGNSYKSNPLTMDFVKVNNGRDGAFMTKPKENVLNAQAQEYYNEHKEQFDQQYTEKGQNPLDAAKQFILSGIETKYDNGDKNTLHEAMALAKYNHSLKTALETPNSSPYKISILNTDYAKPPAEDLAATFGSNIPHILPAGKEGNPIDNTGDIFHYDGDIQDKGYRADGKYKKTGIKTVNGFALKPLEFGDEVGYTYDPWGTDNIAVRPEYKDFVSIIDSPMDKEGKSHKVLKIKTTADVNANDPSYQGKWDKNISTTKQREGFGINESMVEQPQTFNTSLSDLKNAGYTDSQIKTGVEKGIFIIK